MLLSLTTGLAVLGAVSAHTGCGGHEIGARNLGGRVITKRQVADNVEGESRFRFPDVEWQAGVTPGLPHRSICITSASARRFSSASASLIRFGRAFGAESVSTKLPRMEPEHGLRLPPNMNSLFAMCQY